MVSVLSAVRDLARLREISSVLVRHGFGEIVARAGFGRTRRKEKAVAVESGADADAPEIASEEVEKGEDEKQRISIHERARLVLQDLGPSFIKLGQIASTRSDVLPPELIAELKKLQDNIPPAPFEQIRGVIESSLGAPIGEVFVSFDEKPLAAASIGQVHRAVLATPEGQRDVVVKVQRPGVAPTVMRDLELLHIMAAAIERAIPDSRIYSPVGLVQQFDRSITTELNFTTEADNAERFAQNFAGKERVRFPRVFREASSKHVLTLEYFDGKKLDRAVAEGASGESIAKLATGIIIKMIFEDGFFHADPHPGNVIILPPNEAPEVAMIDLGMVGRLSPELRERTVDLMVAAVRKDMIGVADALYAIGKPTKKIDMREYRAEVAMLAEKYLGKPLKQIELSGMIRDLVQGAIKYGLEIPTDFMLVGKALMTVEGIGKEIYPELDVFGETAPYFFEIMRKRYSPVRLGNELWRGVEQLSRAGYDMPMQVREVLEDLRLGRMAMRAEDPGLPTAADRLGRRLFSGLVVVALVIGGVVLVHDERHETLGTVLLVVAGLVWAVHVVNDLRRGLARR
ncbi:MAG TPA: AarF/ABC1/UbiB kinase family protein [Polyangiaceae bacterium]|nr:AarF/ABC1/UbiB kinase family protein [Polyangiaceae bacterium]